MYYFGRCSSELAQLVPFPFSRGKSTCYFFKKGQLYYNETSNSQIQKKLKWPSLNVSKIKYEGDLRIKLCGKRIYLGVKINANLIWQYVNDLSIKQNTTNAVFFKMRKYVNLKI